MIQEEHRFERISRVNTELLYQVAGGEEKEMRDVKV